MDSKKTIAVCVCASIFIGCCIWTLVVGKKCDQAFAALSERIRAEQAALQAKLDAAQLKLGEIPDWQTGLPVLDPIRLVNRLYELPEGPFDRFCEANFVFQGLVDGGTNSIPAILKYFESGADEKLMISWDQIGAYTIRQGLITALDDIGGSEAVALLSRIIQYAANTQELTTLVESLMKTDPDFYHPFCIKIARNTLKSYSAQKSTGKFWDIDDPIARQEMYKILFEILKDVDLATEMADAGAHIREDAGTLDDQLLGYFNKALGADVGKICLDFFKAPDTDRYSRLTFFDYYGMNDWAAQYIGTSPEFTTMFNTVLQEGDNPTFRAKMISNLMEWDRLYREKMPPDVALARLGMMDSLQSQYGSDPMVAHAIEQARNSLRYQSAPDTYERPTYVAYESSEEDKAEYELFQKKLRDDRNALMLEKINAKRAAKELSKLPQ